MDILHFVVSSHAVDLVGPEGQRVEEKSICIGEPTKRLGAVDTPRLQGNGLCLIVASRARWHMWSSWELLVWKVAIKRSTQLLLFCSWDKSMCQTDVAVIFRGASARTARRRVDALSTHHGNFSGSESQHLRSCLIQQIARRHKGIEIAGPVYAKACRVLVDPENTNEQGAKITDPEIEEDKNEATEAYSSGKKEDMTSFKRWMDGHESTRLDSTRLKLWVSAAYWSQDGRNCQDGGKQRRQW
jgi:hypothetical protein